MAANFFALFWKYLKRSIAELKNPRILAFYGTAAIMFSVVSYLIPYQTQVYLPIAAGFVVTLLLIAWRVLYRGFT